MPNAESETSAHPMVVSQLITDSLALALALGLVTLVVIAPGSYLLRLAWRRGGVPRKLAVASLLALGVLVVWLFSPRDGDTSVEERISLFAGAWGLLVMGLGLVVIAAAALGKFRDDETSDDS